MSIQTIRQHRQEVQQGNQALLQLLETTAIPGTNQMWRLDLSRRITNKEDVEQYLGSLNTGEYSDWRLPDKHELQTLFDVFDVHGRGDV